MTKFKVAYIDEDESDIRRFQRFADDFFNVIPLIPDREIENTVFSIFEHNVDAIIADFELSEQNVSIHYNGAELIRFVLEEREHFPVFILTSYEEDAVSQGDDVNIVYEKNIMNDGETFLTKVKSQIEKYIHRLDEAENRILELTEKSKTVTLDVFEEEELFKLDAMIEKAFDKKSKIPEHLRKANDSDELIELLKKVDDLTKKIESKNE
jgi:predicted Zn-dependent protease with MMP-like domain